MVRLVALKLKGGAAEKGHVVTMKLLMLLNNHRVMSNIYSSARKEICVWAARLADWNNLGR